MTGWRGKPPINTGYLVIATFAVAVTSWMLLIYGLSPAE